MNKATIPFSALPLRVDKWIDEQGSQRAPLTLDELGQGYIILYCFQAWCPGCHASGFPSLQTLVDRLSGHDFSFAAIQTVFEGAEQNTPERVREMQLRYDLKIPFAHDHVVGGLPTIMQDYQTGGTPWFIVIDPNKQVVFNDFRLDANAFVDLFENVASSTDPEKTI